MNRKTRKPVDYTLLARRRISDYLEELSRADLKLLDLAPALQKLERMGPEVIPVCLSRLPRADERQARVITAALEFLDDDSVVGPLLEMMADPGVSDQVKQLILGSLGHFGVETDQLPLDEFFRDIDRMRRNSLSVLLDGVKRDELILVQMLESFDEQDPELKPHYVYALGETKDERALPILQVLARIPDSAVRGAVIEVLGDMGSARALVVLERLAREGHTPEIRTQAHRAAMRLRNRGFEAVPAEPDRGPSAAEVAGPLHRVVISSIDGRGSRAVWIARRNPKTRPSLTTVHLLLNTEVGIKDCFGMRRVAVADFNEQIRELTESGMIYEGDFEYATKLIQDALVVSEKNGTLPPSTFYYWQDLLEPEWLAPRPYEVDLGASNNESDPADDGLLDASLFLMEHPIFDDWYVEEEEVYDFADEAADISKRYRSGLAGEREMASLELRFYRSLIEPNLPELQRRLELQADFLRLVKAPYLARIAAAARLTLRPESSQNHPFIRAIIKKSLDVARQNMDEGFDLRLNPEAFE